ncbi:S8 family peptidase [Clostridium butyricum]|uniref:S8 family peptidase n=1 Tax=Clostridium butyricum TaxID=1492 RepID=UPI003D33AA6A
MSNDKSDLYYDPITENYLIEYKGNFKEQIDKIDYAVGDVLTETLGVIAVERQYIAKLLKDVPSIIYVDFRLMFVLQDISPNYIDNINNIKINPYLGLDGYGVTVGIADTGIDYLNEEFIREDGTSRILSIWDQSIRNTNPDKKQTYIGTIYTNEQINAAINAYKNNEDPYAIVPSKDERGHGTKIAGIIGARGANDTFKGIANNCNFIIVKLMESTNFKALLKKNQIEEVPVYNTSEIIAGIEYLKIEFLKLQFQAMVIYLGLGATEGSHDGGSVISQYLSLLGNLRGICLVAGVGNEGDAQGHATGYIKAQGDVSTQELYIPKELKIFTINIWMQKPNKASISIISPTEESSKLINVKINRVEKFKFIFTNTEFTVFYRTPDHYTGHDVIRIEFRNIKPGIWKLRLTGEYILGGRYDIWLPPHKVLPEKLVFLEPNPYNTLTFPSTAQNIISVSYYGNDNAIMSSSGKGFNTNITGNNLVVKPDLSTIGLNILTTKPGGGIATLSGSSSATAVICGACALLLQWGIVNKNDPTMYSNKIRSYLIYGATRNNVYKYPNRESGYGEFNLLGTFNIIAKLYNYKRMQIFENDSTRISIDNKKIINIDFFEYNVKSLYIRIPRNNLGDFICQKVF